MITPRPWSRFSRSRRAMAPGRPWFSCTAIRRRRPMEARTSSPGGARQAFPTRLPGSGRFPARVRKLRRAAGLLRPVCAARRDKRSGKTRSRWVRSPRKGCNRRHQPGCAGGGLDRRTRFIGPYRRNRRSAGCAQGTVPPLFCRRNQGMYEWGRYARIPERRGFLWSNLPEPD